MIAEFSSSVQGILIIERRSNDEAVSFVHPYVSHFRWDSHVSATSNSLFSISQISEADRRVGFLFLFLMYMFFYSVLFLTRRLPLTAFLFFILFMPFFFSFFFFSVKFSNFTTQHMRHYNGTRRVIIAQRLT